MLEPKEELNNLHHERYQSKLVFILNIMAYFCLTSRFVVHSFNIS
jgi:hypothetical protein